MADYKTRGERLVRVDFSVHEDPGVRQTVSEFKKRFAELVNDIEAIPLNEQWSEADKQEVARNKARAYTFLEDASNAVVKALTT